IYAGHLADALEQHWELSRDPADLDEAARSAALAAELDGSGARVPDLLTNLAHTLLARYQELGDRADVDAALEALRRIRPVRGRDRGATGGAGPARALALRYQDGGDPGDLAAAIRAARRGLVGVGPGDVVYHSRTARLAMLLALRYQRQGGR